MKRYKQELCWSKNILKGKITKKEKEKKELVNRSDNKKRKKKLV